MTNLPKLSTRAAKALEILADGGEFRHGLERNSHTGREQFSYRLQLKGKCIKGIGISAFHELQQHGMLAVTTGGTSVSTYYKLATR